MNYRDDGESDPDRDDREDLLDLEELELPDDDLEPRETDLRFLLLARELPDEYL